MKFAIVLPDGAADEPIPGQAAVTIEIAATVTTPAMARL